MNRSPLGILLTLGGACAPEPIVDRPEDAPDVAILSPAPGSVVPAGRIELLARVSDAIDPPERLFVTWSAGQASSDDEGTWRPLCDNFADAEGLSLCTAELTEDDTVVRVQATDVPGFRGQDRVTLTVRAVEPPQVTLLQPSPFDDHYLGEPIALEALVDDPDHGPEELSLALRSSLVGPLPDLLTADRAGRVLTAVSLVEGQHELTLTATDPDGGVGEASVRLLVGPPNEPPTCTWSSPVDSAAQAPGTPWAVSVTAVDTVSPPEHLSLTVASDLDGPLLDGPIGPEGAYDAVIPGLSEGVHALALTVTDPVGARCERSRVVVVDTPPSVSFASPDEGETVPAGQSVVFTLQVSDAVDDAEDLTLTLTSDLDGPRWTGSPAEDGTVSAAVLLSPGTHWITAEATDGYGLVGSAERSVVVGAP